MAPLWATALSTVLVLIGSGTMPIGDGADVKFAVRILQLAAGSGYVAAALVLFNLHRQRHAVKRTANSPISV